VSAVNIDYLRTFLEVARVGSFSEVAKRLSISQPAVSFQIHKLERDLGVRLVERGHKPVRVTDAGRRLIRFAEAVERERAVLTGELEQLREGVEGTIVVAASTIPGEIILPPMLGEFRALHPAVGAQVEVSDSLTVIGCVSDGRCDVGFCGIVPEGRDLQSFKVAQDEIVLIVFPEHPFAGRREVSSLELEGESILMRSQTSGTQQSLKALLAKAGLDVDKWSSSLVLGSSQAVVSAVEAKVGIAFVSNLAIEKSLALGLVKQVPVEGLELRRDFYCVYHHGKLACRLVSEFISFVQARATQA
jgi:DNA-binding transcriptional LysR family regulator